MSSKIPPLAVQYTQVTNKALGLAVKIAASTQQEKKAALDLVPGVVELLKKAGLIDKHQVKTASAQLGDHSEVLNILHNVVTRYEGQLKETNAKTASANLGGPSDEAGEALTGNQKNANYTGYRRGDDDPLADSDRALAAGLGVTLSR